MAGAARLKFILLKQICVKLTSFSHPAPSLLSPQNQPVCWLCLWSPHWYSQPIMISQSLSANSQQSCLPASLFLFPQHQPAYWLLTVKLAKYSALQLLIRTSQALCTKGLLLHQDGMVNWWIQSTKIESEQLLKIGRLDSRNLQATDSSFATTLWFHS